MQAPRVYSCLRFSDAKQAKGTSIARQMEYTAKWAADHNLTLDSSLSLQDEGLSAYHEKHVKQGALGTFLRAVDEGFIPRGPILIVEALDRLSRAEPLLALAQLAQIVNAGITVVTACDSKEYNREGMTRQPMDLFSDSSCARIMTCRHKSRHVRGAIAGLCENWMNGTHRGYIRAGRDPSWVV